MRSFMTAAGALGAALFAMAGCEFDPQQQQPNVPGDCALKGCGESCRVCDPNDPTCVETAEVKFCQGDGTCAPLTPTCGAENPCAVTLCPSNTTCVVLHSYPPQAHCVAADACAAVQCPTGRQCIGGACVPAQVGAPCGTNVCGAGEFCCNASCGTCAPLGGACTQQFCPPQQ